MRAKEYLKQLKRLEIRIKQKSEELDALMQSTYYPRGIDYADDKVNGGFGGDIYRAVDRYIDLEKEIRAQIAEYRAKRHIIVGKIQELTEDIYTELLYKRYVEFKRFERIADEMGYSYDYIRRMHGRALRAFERQVLGDDVQG